MRESETGERGGSSGERNEVIAVEIGVAGTGMKSVRFSDIMISFSQRH